MQAAKAPPSRLHARVTAPQLSLALKVNVAAVSVVVAAGFWPIDTLGSVRSATVQVRSTGSLMFSPSVRSSARTAKV